MADDDSESLREFATFIQQKAAQPESNRQPSSAGADEPASQRQESPQTGVAARPKMVIAGIAAGIGVAIGFLLGKLKR